MKIISIRIQNFRSIKSAEFAPADFNVMVGQNNHGKTNIFRAVEWFYLGKGDIEEIKTAAVEDGDVEVELTFGGVQQGISSISNTDNQTKLRAALGESDTMRVMRSSKTPKDRVLHYPEAGQWKKQPCGVDSAFNNCIPRFEFIEATKNLKDVSGFSTKSPIGQMLSGVLNEILEKDPAYKAFRESFEKLFQAETSGVQKTLSDLSGKVCGHLQNQFPDCTSLDFNIAEPAFDDLLKNFSTRLNDGVETSAEEKGDGMQRALMLAIIKTHADFRRADALGRSFIFFIDEAELHLHPTAQRQLKATLLDLSQSVDQVFINTHSSVLIADEHSKQRVFRVDKGQGATTIQQIEQQAKQEVIYELLGGNPADLLLPCNFLIVEGASEEIFLNGIIRRFYADKPQVQVVKADGDDERQRQNMEAINLVLKPLSYRPIYRKKLTILCDQPDHVKLPRFNEFKAANPHLEANGQLHILGVPSLEQAYPAAWRPSVSIGSKQKKPLAKSVAEEITQAVFEAEMPIVFAALTHCWENAY